MDNSKLKKIKFKRMLSRYESSLDDLEYLREMASEINSEFSSALAAKKRQDLFESKKVEELSEESEIEEKELNGDRDPLFKKLFRKIVIKCHPDRMDPDLSAKDKSEYLDLYDIATNANDDNNIALLITVAIKLEIELTEDYFEHVQKIQEEADKVEEEIGNIQNSVAWKWYHTEEDQRNVLLDNYIKHMEKVLLSGGESKKIDILGIGHPRTGTGYTAKILNSWGLKVGHEKLKLNGIIAWQLAIDKGPWPYMPGFKNNLDYKFLIYNVRDPKDSIPSIAFTENTKMKSTKFRTNGANIETSDNRIEFAINCILTWDKLISDKKPDFVFRIEDQSKNLFDFLKSNNLNVEWDDSHVNTKVNARSHNSWDKLEDDLKTLRPSYKKKINTFCIKYGYNPLF